MSYEFEHSVECRAGRGPAWAFWSDVSNWAAVDPAVEAVTIDGPFAAGARGLTKTRGQGPVAWRLCEVTQGRGAVVEIGLPGAAVRFAWAFEESAGGGTRITQRVTLQGESAADYSGGMEELRRAAPEGMRRLARAIEKGREEASS